MECPTQLPTSWWDWAVQVLVATGTIGAVVVALFGDVLRHWFLPPRLRLTVDSLEGVPTPVQVTRTDVQGRATVTTGKSRYWHVRVRNERRWLPAHNVQVLVLKIEMPGPDGLPQTRFEGETPMLWGNQELYTSGRNVGPSGRVALCSVIKDDGFGLHPIILPFSMPVSNPKVVRHDGLIFASRTEPILASASARRRLLLGIYLIERRPRRSRQRGLTRAWLRERSFGAMSVSTSRDPVRVPMTCR